MIGKIQKVKLREVWKNEARDFTTWLEENIDVLNESLNLSIVSAEREQRAGDFNVDLLCEDENGNTIVIENQLERSNHDHLGKLITYLTAFDAKIAIWIVSEPRPEHVKAISWLNESSSASFYLVKVEAIRIENSDPAPLLTLITGPSIEARETGKLKKEYAESHNLRFEFWTGLLDKSKGKTKLHSGISAGIYNWVGSGVGLPTGLTLIYSARQHDAQIELYIDRGPNMEEENKSIFQKLHAQRETIENSFGSKLNWEFLEGKRACRLSKVIPTAGYRDEDKWSEAHEIMIENMIAFEKALRPHFKLIIQ